jgi:hypothetical protein
MILEILHGTPFWVFALFAYLFWMGFKRMRPRVIDVRRIWITPVIFIVWGLSGLLQRPDAQASSLMPWLIAALAGAAIGFAIRQSLQVDRKQRRVLQPASTIPLVRNVAIFGAHYALNVAAAIHPHARGDIMAWDIVVSGLSAGYFIGWMIRFAHSYRVAVDRDLGVALTSAS